ncbi:MAG: MYXO-CTERM sorting domain-containing protein [Myxococcota bacterium]
MDGLKSVRALVGGAVVAWAWLGLATPANAGAPECNGVHVDRGAQCKVEVSAGCNASCDVGAVLDVCAADLMASCQAGCDLDSTVTCSDPCREACEDSCRADGGQVICNDNCMFECEGACNESCADAEDPSQCFASCEATCSGECEEACSDVPPDADCNTACQECCHGSCRARVNLDCQIGCQATGFASCQDSALEACSASCGIEGTLFCDEQYVMSGVGIDDCINALQGRGVYVEVDVDVDIDVDIDEELEDAFGGSEDSDGKPVGLCSVSSRGGGWSSLAVLGLLGLVAMRRRRV